MDMSIHNSLHEAALKILRPLVRVLLKHGVSHGIVAELCRQAFVEEGFEHMARAGRRPTVSGVSALTGLSRKEVKRLSETDGSSLQIAEKRRNRAIRVISGWVNDKQFQSDGEPAALPLEGSGASFAELVRIHSGDVTPAAMLSLLEDSGNVRVDNGKAVLKKKAFIPLDTSLDLLNILGTDTAELIDTISHNMMAAPEERLFQRKVSTSLIDREALPEFRELSSRRSQALLEEYDAWLAEHEITDQENQESAYVAIGIYYVEHFEQEI